MFSIGYYAEQDLPFIPSVARSFTTFDRFFCSLLSSTYPNREYMHAAQSYGKVDNSLPSGTGFPDTTIFAALDRVGVSNRYFYTDVPVSALWGAAGLSRSAPVHEFYQRAAQGTLPAVSYVDPAFNGEEQGISGDEHPHGDVRAGQAFMADVVHAFASSRQLGHQHRLRPDGLSDSGRGGVAVRPPRSRRPWHLRVRVDPARCTPPAI